MAAQQFQNRVAALKNLYLPQIGAASWGLASSPNPSLHGTAAVVSLQYLSALDAAARKFAELGLEKKSD